MKRQIGIKAVLVLILGTVMLCCVPAEQLKAQDFGPLLDSELLLSAGFTVSAGAKWPFTPLTILSSGLSLF